MRKIYLLLTLLFLQTGFLHSQCTPALKAGIFPDNANYCGTPITLFAVNSSLNNNTGWVWYSGTCGGTPIGTGPSITVSPSVATTYYVRGEGNCTSGPCSDPVTVRSDGLGSIIQMSTGLERCGFGSVDLSAKADHGTIYWYKAASGGGPGIGPFGTGENFTASESTYGTQTYYLEIRDGGCISPRLPLTFEVKQEPQWSSMAAPPVCPGGQSNLDVTPRDANTSVNGWYDAPNGTMLSSTSTYTTPPLTSQTIFYAKLTQVSGCVSFEPALVTIRSIPDLVSTTPGERCGPGAVLLSAEYSGPIGQYRWWDAATGGSQVSSSQNFVPTVTSNTTYYVEATSNFGCVSSSRAPVTATIKSVPTITGSTPASRCGNGTLTLSATGSSGTLSWWNAETGGAQVGTGASYTTPSLTQTTPYFVQATNNGCTSGRSSVMATVNPIPTVSASSNAECDTGPVNLGATSNGTVSWFANAIGGSALATGLSFTTPAITTTTVYYVQATLNGCTTPSRSSVSAIIRTTPTITSTTPGTRCGEGQLSIMATPSAGTVQWYNVASGGSVLSTNNTYSPTITATTTYYVSAFNLDCESARTPVIATINPNPTLTTSDASRCDAGTVTLSAASNGTVSWFAASTGGSSLGTGNSFTTPSISTTTQYFAQALLGSCTSPARVAATAMVINTPAQPTITQNNTNIESPVLTSSATSGNQWFKDDLAISGATNTTYTITDAGEYKVQVNSSGCLSAFSIPINYVITGFEVADERMLNIYPNPSADEVTISLAGFDVDRLVQIDVVDLLGRRMSQSTSLGGEQVKFNVRGYQSGQYLVLAQQGSRKIIRQFIKSK
jgi:hypothetical protein